MIYPSFIELPFAYENSGPRGEDDSDKYPESLVRYFLKEYAPKNAQKNMKVFDPFMGWGTTAFVAEELYHIPYGMEADRARFEFAAGQIENWKNIICGDSADLMNHDFPKMDFAITSPPYMPSYDRWNPLYGGDPKYDGYDTYLARMGEIFAHLKTIMKRDALIVVQADNLQHKSKSYTPLVKDFADVISKTFPLEAEIIVKWLQPNPDYLHTHCLVFKNR